MPDRFVRASEIGEYEFCARAWWLAHVLGRERENPGELAAGRERHQRHGQALDLAVIFQFIGAVLIMTSVVVAILMALTGGAH
jgi:hypothetical protein